MIISEKMSENKNIMKLAIFTFTIIICNTILGIKPSYKEVLNERIYNNEHTLSIEDSLVIKNVKNDLIFEIKNTNKLKENIKYKVIDSIKSVNITFTDFKKFKSYKDFKFVDNLNGFYVVLDKKPYIFINSNAKGYDIKDMIVYHELRHYVDDLIVDDFYKRSITYSDFSKLNDIIMNTEDVDVMNNKLLKKSIYVSQILFKDSINNVDGINYESNIRIDDLCNILNNSEMYVNTTKDIFRNISNVDVNYTFSKSELYVRMCSLKRYLYKKGYLSSINDNIKKEHIILLLSNMDLNYQFFSTENIDFYLLLYYIDFDLTKSEKTLKDISIERKINSII